MKNCLILFGIFFILSCSSDDANPEQVGSDDVIEAVVNPTGTYTILHGGLSRTYHYYHPIDLPENSPLIFVLHGYAANAEDFMDWLPMHELADEHDFALVYPQGFDDNSGMTHWNADLTISNIDDVGFLKNLALHLQNTYKLNPERTFISGFSNGGFMSYEMIVKQPDIFKAAASIAGTMSGASWDNRTIAQPVPVLQLSGALDRTVPITGMNTTVGGWDGAPPIAEIMDFWAELNEADDQEFIEMDQTKITKYINSTNGNEVWYYLLENLEHNIPREGNYNVDTPSLIWNFFNKY